MMSVQVPVGMQEGMSLVVQTPLGNMMLTIPQGLQPGDMFQFQVPVAQPGMTPMMQGGMFVNQMAQPGMTPMMQGGMFVNQMAQPGMTPMMQGGMFVNQTNVTQQINVTNVTQSKVGGPQAQTQTVPQPQPQPVPQPQTQPQPVPQPQTQTQTVPHGIWIVAWHDGSAQGQAHRSRAAAETQFSELDGGNWAACLFDPALLVIRCYGGWLDDATNLKVLTDHAQRLALEATKTAPSEGMHAAHVGQPDVIARDETSVRLPRALEKGDCLIVAGTPAPSSLPW
jgi:hypothetical protein